MTALQRKKLHFVRGKLLDIYNGYSKLSTLSSAKHHADYAKFAESAAHDAEYALVRINQILGITDTLSPEPASS